MNFKELDLSRFFDEPFHDLYYGASGSGKTLFAAQLAKWLWINRKLKTRWLVGDGGFQTVSNLGLVRAGAVEMLDYTNMPEPVTTLNLLAEGWWIGPDRILRPPDPDLYEKVGLWVFEGLSVACHYIMGDVKGGLEDKAARGIKVGIEAVVSLKDDTKIGGQQHVHAMQAGWGPYSYAQSKIMGVKNRTDRLPRTIWTAHERLFDDTKAKPGTEKVIGPEIAGKALTPTIAGKFGNTFHFTTVSKKGKSKDPHSGAEVRDPGLIRRVYTTEHYDPDGIIYTKYVANNRSPGDRLKDYYDLLVPTDGLKPIHDICLAKEEAERELE